jgi:hypothetical protein
MPGALKDIACEFSRFRDALRNTLVEFRAEIIAEDLKKSHAKEYIGHLSSNRGDRKTAELISEGEKLIAQIDRTILSAADNAHPSAAFSNLEFRKAYKKICGS